MATPPNQPSALGALLGRNITERRKQLGWTQADLAERLGVDSETISRFERGSNLPSLLRLEALALIMDAPLAALLAESSTHPLDQSRVLAELIGKLGEKDRLFVVNIVKLCCGHLE